jgi:hypothetical protein
VDKSGTLWVAPKGIICTKAGSQKGVVSAFLFTFQEKFFKISFFSPIPGVQIFKVFDF